MRRAIAMDPSEAEQRGTIVGPHRNELVIKRFKDDGSSLLILLLCCFWPAGSASASVIGSLFSTRAINHKDCSSWPPRQIKTAKAASTTRAEEC